MNSTITVIPTENTEITFGEIIKLSEKYINSSLDIIKLQEKVKIQASIFDYNGAENKESYLEVNLGDIFKWKKNQLIIFSSKEISGTIKTDHNVIFDPETDPQDPWWPLNGKKDNTKTINNLETKFEKAKKINKSWFLHNSDKKDETTNIICAIISASIAELTSGLISSSDQTWGFGQYFIEKDEFLKFYLQPTNESIKENFLNSKENIIDTGFWYKLKKIFR